MESQYSLTFHYKEASIVVEDVTSYSYENLVQFLCESLGHQMKKIDMWYEDNEGDEIMITSQTDYNIFLQTDIELSPLIHLRVGVEKEGEEETKEEREIGVNIEEKSQQQQQHLQLDENNDQKDTQSINLFHFSLFILLFLLPRACRINKLESILMEVHLEQAQQEKEMNDKLYLLEKQLAVEDLEKRIHDLLNQKKEQQVKAPLKVEREEIQVDDKVPEEPEEKSQLVECNIEKYKVSELKQLEIIEALEEKNVEEPQKTYSEILSSSVEAFEKLSQIKNTEELTSNFQTATAFLLAALTAVRDTQLRFLFNHPQLAVQISDEEILDDALRASRIYQLKHSNILEKKSNKDNNQKEMQVEMQKDKVIVDQDKEIAASDKRLLELQARIRLEQQKEDEKIQLILEEKEREAARLNQEIIDNAYNNYPSDIIEKAHQIAAITGDSPSKYLRLVNAFQTKSVSELFDLLFDSKIMKDFLV